MIGLDFRFTDMQIKQRTEQKRSSMDIMRIIWWRQISRKWKMDMNLRLIFQGSRKMKLLQNWKMVIWQSVQRKVLIRMNRRKKPAGISAVNVTQEHVREVTMLVKISQKKISKQNLNMVFWNSLFRKKKQNQR